MKNLSKYFDHTNLKPNATKDDIKKLCNEAIENNFYSVCVNGSNIELAKDILKGTDVKVATVIGFPLGASSTFIKITEADEYIKAGADEIDMVINIGRAKDKDFKFIETEIKEISKITRKNNIILKTIIETDLLNDDEKIKICNIIKDLDVDFIKTSTGFTENGANEKDIKLIKDIIGGKMGIKASGGIRDLKSTLKLIEAGATRIGASASVKILEEYKNACSNSSV